MLKQSKYKISDIAQQVGYQDGSSFTRAFIDVASRTSSSPILRLLSCRARSMISMSVICNACRSAVLHQPTVLIFLGNLDF